MFRHSVRHEGGQLIRWFADLPIERKLRVAIMVPATAAFGIALAMHIATNVLNFREDMLRRASRVAETIAPSLMTQSGAGDSQPAASASNVLRDEPMVS